MALAALAALAGATVQSAGGFGFALVLSPALFAVMEPAEAVTMLLLLGVVVSGLVLAEGRDAVRWRVLPPLLLAALPGLAAGAVLLSALSKEPLQVAVGVAVVAAALWQRHDAHAGRRVPAVAAGFVSGTLTTSLSINGPPLVLWLEAHGLRPAELRATLAAAFVVLNVLGGAVVVGSERGEAALELGEVSVLLVCVVAGYAVGAVAFRRLDERRFAAIVLVLLVCSGLASIAAGLL